MPISEIDGRRIDYDIAERRWRWFDTGELVEPSVEADHFGPQLEQLKAPELLELANERGIEIPSGTRKAEIIQLIKGAP